MQRRQRTHGLLGTAAAAVLLAMTLGLAGCGSDGDDGAQGPPGPQGPQGPRGEDAVTVTDAAFGVDSPNASLCYSCHQNRDDQNLVRAHIDALGGEMFGFATHLDFTGPEGCTTCHGGLRPGSGLDGLSDLEILAGVEHQARRPAPVNTSSVTDVQVDPATGQVTMTFQIIDYALETVHAEFTIAKWVPAQGAWINLLQRAVGGDPAAGEGRVIRGGNLRQQNDRILTGGIVDPTGGPIVRGRQLPATTFTYTFISDRDNGWGSAGNFAGTATDRDNPLNFVNSPLWRASGEADPTTYCAAGDTACVNFVNGLMTEINTDGAWDLAGTYRVGVTGRDRDDTYVRFAAVADVTLNGSGGFAGAPADPAPTNQIAQASCNTCHGDRLAFPRNNVHGGQRPAVAVCSNCHNPYTYDADASSPVANGWASISANVMIHKIHTGIEGYTVDGYEYENVRYPDFTLAGNSNCASCHNATENGFGGGWDRQDPSVAIACGTCHSVGGVDVQLGVHAPGNPNILGSCANCHGDIVTAGLGYQQSPDAYHGVSARLEELRIQREEFAFSLVSVEDAVYEGTPVVRWQVLDGQGNPYHLANDISIDGGPRLHIGWGYRDDWTNEGSGEKSAFGNRENDDNGRPVALNVATTGDNANTVLSDDGLTAISTFPRLTDDEAGQGLPYANLAAAEEGRRGFVAIHRRVSDNGAIRQITSVVQPIMLGSGEVEFAPARRNTVDATFGVETGRRGTGCLDCHGTITAHGGGYIMDGDVQACITCHNAGSHESRNVAALNGREPRSVDFMYFMHDLHGIGLVSVDDGKALFPQNMAARCHSCHAGSSNDGNVNGFMNPAGVSNCTLCHDGAVNPGRLGVLSNWPGANARYGLRGDGTDGE